MLRFFLNGNLVTTEPSGYKGLTERLYYSEDLKVNLVEVTGTLKFYNDEREFIYRTWLNNSCSIIPLEIQKNVEGSGLWRAVFKGYVFISDVVFHDAENSVECQITDNSFIAMIDNNKDLEMNLGVSISKNGVDISSYYTTNSIGEVFTFSSGGGTYSNRLTISVYDAFAALIAFMTDGTVEFDSEFFDYTAPAWTEGNNYFLINGSELRTGAGEILPTISFNQLYTDLQRCYNLRIGIETATNGKPLIRIEPKEYWRNTDTILLTDIESVKFQRKIENQYTSILVGSDVADELNDYNLFNYLFYTWKNKQYFLTGQCNDVNNDLDLRFDTICADVRAINEVGSGGSEKDSTTFLYAEAIHDGGANEFWYPFELFVPSLFYNNKSTRNGNVIDRYSDDIFSSVAQYDYFLNDAYVGLASPQTMTAFEDIIFDNDSTGGFYDNGNTYNNITGEYTVKQTGTYRMRFNVELKSTGGSSTFEIGFAFSFGGSPIGIGWYYPGQDTSATYTLASGASGIYELEYEVPLLEGTDVGGLFEAVVTVQVNKTAGSGTLTTEAGSTFEIFTAGSGIFREFDANTAYSKQIEATGSISTEDWDLIKGNRYARIQIQGNRQVYDGYIQEMTRSIEAGTTGIKIIGKP